MRYQIKELSLGGVLDQAVTLTKNHFGLLFGVTLVLLIPFGLIQGLVQLALAPELPTNATLEDMLAAQEAAQQAMLSNLPITLPIGLVGLFIVLPITNAAVIHAIANQYLEKQATVGSSIGRALGIMGPLIWTWSLLYLAVMGGIILCVIPGIIFAFWFSLATQIVVVEGTSGTAALKRSKELMRGNIATIFVLGLLVGVINAAVGLGAGFIPQVHLQVIGSVVAQAIITIFAAAAFVVFYFSCRCKHENFDLTLLAQSVGAEAPDQAADKNFPQG